MVRAIMISFFFGSRLCPVCVASLRYKAVCRLKANSEHPYPSEQQQQEWADSEKISGDQIKNFFVHQRQRKTYQSASSAAAPTPLATAASTVVATTAPPEGADLSNAELGLAHTDAEGSGQTAAAPNPQEPKRKRKRGPPLDAAIVKEMRRW